MFPASELRFLVQNEAGYRALLAYIAKCAKDADNAFQGLAQAAVLDPSGRDSALIKYGQKTAMEDLFTTLSELSTTGHMEGP